MPKQTFSSNIRSGQQLCVAYPSTHSLSNYSVFGLSLTFRSFFKDFPRWGDYPDKLKLEYLDNLKRTGEESHHDLGRLYDMVHHLLLLKLSEKNDTYLSLFVISGQWFDGSQPASFVNLTMDPDFAPEFLLTHLDKYKELVEK